MNSNSFMRQKLRLYQKISEDGSNGMGIKPAKRSINKKASKSKRKPRSGCNTCSRKKKKK